MVRRLGDIGCEELAADTGFISLYLILPVFEKKRRKVMRGRRMRKAWK